MARLRLVTGTRRGLGMWAGQTFTAVFLLLLTVYLLVLFAVVAPTGYYALRELLGAAYFRVPATIGAVALIWHAALGAKSIIMDYVKWPWLRVVKYVGSFFYFSLVLIWFLGVIWQ